MALTAAVPYGGAQDAFWNWTRLAKGQGFRIGAGTAGRYCGHSMNLQDVKPASDRSSDQEGSSAGWWGRCESFRGEEVGRAQGTAGNHHLAAGSRCPGWIPLTNASCIDLYAAKFCCAGYPVTILPPTDQACCISHALLSALCPVRMKACLSRPCAISAGKLSPVRRRYQTGKIKAVFIIPLCESGYISGPHFGM